MRFFSIKEIKSTYVKFNDLLLYQKIVSSSLFFFNQNRFINESARKKKAKISE